MDKSARTPSLTEISQIAHPVERIGALAKWVCARATEMEEQEQKLVSREKQLERLDKSLRDLTSQLHVAMGNAGELLSRLDEARSMPAPAAPAELPVQAWDLATEALAPVVQQLEQKLVDRAKQLDEDFAATLQSMHSYVDDLLNRTRLAAEESAEQIRDRAEEAVGVARETIEQIEQRDRESVEQLLEQHGRRAAEMFADAEARFRRQLAEFTTSLESARGAVELRMNESLGALHEQASSVATLASGRIRQQVDEIEADIRTALRPVMQRVQEMQQGVESQLRGQIETIEQTIKSRMGALQQIGEDLAEQVERSLVGRLQALVPMAVENAARAEKSASNRLATLIDGMRAMVITAERELADRIESISPRTRDAAERAEEELSKRLGQIEQSATSLTRSLEQRLCARVDELVTRSRQLMRLSRGDVEDAIDHLKSAAPAA